MWQTQALSTTSSCCDDDHDHGNAKEDGGETPFQQLMNRGDYLRRLRLLALADEAERRLGWGVASEEEKKEDGHRDSLDVASVVAARGLEDVVLVSPGTNRKILDYRSYLAHQRYYDDLKHVDMTYIDYGAIRNFNGEDGGRLVVEQRKNLGKGGIVSSK